MAQNFAGYIETRSGRTVAYALMVNNAGKINNLAADVGGVIADRLPSPTRSGIGCKRRTDWWTPSWLNRVRPIARPNSPTGDSLIHNDLRGTVENMIISVYESTGSVDETVDNKLRESSLSEGLAGVPGRE